MPKQIETMNNQEHPPVQKHPQRIHMDLKFPSSKFQMKPNEVRFIISFLDRNFDMQSMRYEENRKAITERKQEQSRSFDYTTPITFSDGSAFPSCKFQMKPNRVIFIVNFVDRNLDMQSQREEENRNAIMERKQEKSRASD